MKLRSHLLLLTLGTLLPMVIFAVAAAWWFVQSERDTFERGARERVRALLTAVDTELRRTETTLDALAALQHLDTGDLARFHEEATRVLLTQPHWISIDLASTSGEQLLSALHPYGARLPPVAERRSFEEVVRTAKPAMRNLASGDAAGRYTYGVRVPVVRDGTLRYVLSALVSPQAVAEPLSRQRLPRDWVGVVLDANGRVVTRTVDPEGSIGELASESLRGALGRASEGWFLGSSLEGTQVYTPFIRSPFSGWVVAIGIPASAVDASVVGTAWLLGIGVVAATALALLLAVVIGRRISAPIGSLAAVGKALASGTQAELPGKIGVSEVREVGDALVHAANVVRAREAALRAADRAKDDFLAMLSHELRNPLNALAAAAQVLRLTERAGDSASQATGIVLRQVQQMTRLVEDLLDVSRVTRGKISLSRKPLDLAAAVEKAVAEWKASGRLDHHEVRVDLAPAWVHADEARAEQIISNLLGNAAKYTPAGGRISVSVHREQHAAVLRVRDTGMGMSPELAARAFDLFVQGERALDRGPGGLGIGLTLVKRLAELHGGKAFAASAGPGQGSLFAVALPAIDAPLQAEPAPDAKRDETRRYRVLIIEDNEDARRTLGMALKLEGHEVYEAADGPSGVTAADSAVPEVAIVDVGLPGLNGYQVAERIRATPAHDAMLLVALTGYGEPEAHRRARDAGFDTYITKPISPDQLMRLIAVAWAARARRQASARGAAQG